jgi:hypothetical protein
VVAQLVASRVVLSSTELVSLVRVKHSRNKPHSEPLKRGFPWGKGCFLNLVSHRSKFGAVPIHHAHLAIASANKASFSNGGWSCLHMFPLRAAVFARHGSSRCCNRHRTHASTNRSLVAMGTICRALHDAMKNVVFWDVPPCGSCKN